MRKMQQICRPAEKVENVMAAYLSKYRLSRQALSNHKNMLFIGFFSHFERNGLIWKCVPQMVQHLGIITPICFRDVYLYYGLT